MPALVTSMSNMPVMLFVPPNTSSPTDLSTGSDSPVIFAWLMADSPEMILPSAGMLSPGRTRTRSPGCNVLAATSTSPLSVILCAFSGVKCINEAIAARAPRALRDSINSTMIMKKAINPASR